MSTLVSGMGTQNSSHGRRSARAADLTRTKARSLKGDPEVARTPGRELKYYFSSDGFTRRPLPSTLPHVQKEKHLGSNSCFL